MGLTMAEKILKRTSGQASVKPGDYVTCKVDFVLLGEGMANTGDILKEAGINKVWDPSKIVVLADHYVPAPSIRNAQISKEHREAVKEFGIIHDYKERAGVCHQVLMEKGHAKPGMLLLGLDSHTTTCGAVGAAGCGFGYTEMAYILKTGTIWFKVPSTIRINLNGTLGNGVMSKDIVLYIAATYGADFAQYKAIEYNGSAAHAMSVASRMTMSNMGVDLGAKFAQFEADEITYSYLKDRVDPDDEFKLVKNFSADPDAVYEQVIDIDDIGGLEPYVACPHTLENSKPVSQVKDVKINQAFLGSCTNARLEDLEIAAKILKGKKIHPDVRMIILPASTEIFLESMHRGYVDTFIEAGAIIGTPGCGPCGGTHLGVLAAGETCIGTHNRNPRGRMGHTDSLVYLGSPATVAASAIEGKIADPRNHL
jgi:3-isopropylmalate/(R)-2-methylmalate dehydratase large subunit